MTAVTTTKQPVNEETTQRELDTWSWVCTSFVADPPTDAFWQVSPQRWRQGGSSDCRRPCLTDRGRRFKKCEFFRAYVSQLQWTASQHSPDKYFSPKLLFHSFETKLQFSSCFQFLVCKIFCIKGSFFVPILLPEAQEVELSSTNLRIRDLVPALPLGKAQNPRLLLEGLAGTQKQHCKEFCVRTMKKSTI